MSDTGDAVLVDVEDGIATVTLNEPDRRNALSTSIGEGLEAAMKTAEDRDARCLIVESEGDAFSAGGDIEGMLDGIENDVPLDDRVRELERTTSETMARLVTFPLPTVAKVDGTAFGAGANLALACDVQLASENAAIGFGFRNVGLSVDAGTSYLLPRVVGENVAKELVFTGEVLDADRALDLGLFNHVYPTEEFDDHVGAFVDRVASGPTVALRHSKRLLSEGTHKSVDRAMADEAAAQGIVFQSDDHEAGVRAFLDRRDPEFEGR